MTNLEYLQIKDSIENENMRTKLRCFFIGTVGMIIGILLLKWSLYFENHIWETWIQSLGMGIAITALLFLLVTLFISSDIKHKRKTLNQLKSERKSAEEALKILFETPYK